MRKLILTAAVTAGLAVSGCATNRYAYDDPYNSNSSNRTAEGALTGGAVGAATGAAVGAVVGGVSPVQGAIAGGIAGAVLGAVINGRQTYRTTQGQCYYVDQYGRPVYLPNSNC